MYSKITQERLKELRKDLGLTQTDVETGTGIDRSKISRFENGDREPTINDLAKLAEYFDVTTDWLLGIGKKNR